MRTFLTKSLALSLVLVFAAAACAQREEGERGGRGGREGRGRGGFGQFGGGGGFGGRGGGFGLDKMTLVSIEPVQKELGLVEEQITKIGDLRRESRGGRGERGARGERGGERPDFRNMTDEERQEFMAQRQKEAAERAAKENEQLAEILMEHQGKRLQEIYIQVRGVGALQDPEVAKELGLTEDDLDEIRETTQEAREGIQEEMRDLFGSGDREQIQAKMAELQKKVEEEVLAVLTAEQKEKFTAMKGEKFDLPADALRGAFGGGRGGEGGRRGRGGEGRPDRPRRPASDSV